MVMSMQSGGRWGRTRRSEEIGGSGSRISGMQTLKYGFCCRLARFEWFRTGLELDLGFFLKFQHVLRYKLFDFAICVVSGASVFCLCMDLLLLHLNHLFFLICSSCLLEF